MIPKPLQNVLHSEIDPAFRVRSSLIFDEVAARKPRRILDAGCGRGFYLKALTFFSFIKSIDGIDLNTEYIYAASKNISDPRVRLKSGSIYNTPYASNYFDLIICSEVLEHLDSDRKALAELRRILKPRGTLLITVPRTDFPFLWDPLNWVLMRSFNIHVSKDIWWLAGIWADHVRLYTDNQLSSLLQKSMFTIDVLKPVVRGSIPFAHFLLYGIGKNIVEGLGATHFNRFSFKKKPLSQFLATIFMLPTGTDNSARLNKSSVNFFVVARK